MDYIDYKKIFNDNLDDLIGLLKIDSIYDESTVCKEMPYGQRVYKAFAYMKDLAIKDGFVVKSYDNQVLTISYLNKPNKRIDIASHLDVVNVDDSWSYPPFEATIIDNKIIGRGTSDMKVPMFLTYLSLKILRAKYKDTNNEICLVLGTDEERTMNDMHLYLSLVSKPLFAFSPDGVFPMANGEKGALMWTLDGNTDSIIDYLNGGIQCNVVAPNCEMILNDNNLDIINKYIKDNSLDANAYNYLGKVKVNIKGIACHASRNWLGNNAIISALKLVSDLYDDRLASNLYAVFEDKFGLGIDSKNGEDPNTCMTINLGILKIENGHVFGQVDARYPTSLNSDLLTGRLKEKLIINASLDYDDPPTYVDLNDVYVKTMLDTYQDLTNDHTLPIVSGGVSYSKIFKHCVTFGLTHVNDKMMAHQKDEYVRIDECIKALEIYYKTIEKLAFLENDNE